MGLDIIANNRQIACGEFGSPFGVAGNKDGETVDKGYPGLKGALSIIATGLFGANGQVIEHDIRGAITQFLNDFLFAQRRYRGRLKAKMLGVLSHMISIPIHDGAHLYRYPAGRQFGLEDSGTVWLSKNSFMDLFADFACVDVKGCTHPNIAGCIDRKSVV